MTQESRMPSRPNSNAKPGNADKAQTSQHQAGRGRSVENNPRKHGTGRDATEKAPSQRIEVGEASNPRKSEDEGQNRHRSQG